MQVTLQYAEAHLADLVSAACRGEEVEIAQPDQPTLKLVVSAPSPSPTTTKDGRRILGAGRGEMHVLLEEEWNDETVWQNPARPRSEMFGSLKGKLTLPDGWNSDETNMEVQRLFEDSEFFPEASGK